VSLVASAFAICWFAVKYLPVLLFAEGNRAAGYSRAAALSDAVRWAEPELTHAY
jgi:hypothetical protein